MLSVGLAWGVLEGVAAALELEQFELVPRVWQHAVLGREAGDRSAVDYCEVERRLTQFVGTGAAAKELTALRPAWRNHALDAVGGGVFAALRPEQATRI